jgi:hypothetical protein
MPTETVPLPSPDLLNWIVPLLSRDRQGAVTPACKQSTTVDLPRTVLSTSSPDNYAD